MLGTLKTALPFLRGPAKAIRYQQGQATAEEDFRPLAFTMAAIALSARLAACDGKVSRSEYATFRGAFPMPSGEDAKIARLFTSASKETETIISQARLIAKLYPGRAELYEDLIGRLIQIALVDGPINLKEMNVLHQAAYGIGISKAQFDEILRRHVIPASSSPYAALGVASSATPDQLKRRYRQIMREYHPDGLEACGVPPEVVALAAEKVAAVNAAYDAIRRQRGLK
ncbi:MAG: TerB family tellurite resistance protein [Alphaproteobacteria bacterium]|nr:TerB family tellurite resistance protein [Alphaproteobacteria bacterium]